MCFCRIQKPNYDEELVRPNRPRVLAKRQALQRLSLSSQLCSEFNLSTLSANFEPLRAIQLYSWPGKAGLRRSVSQDRIILVETITLRSSGTTVRQRPRLFAEGTLPSNLQRETRPLSIAESNGQLESRLVRATSPRQSKGMVAVIGPQQSGSVAHPLIRSGRQSNAIHPSPRQPATSVRSADYPCKIDNRAMEDEENSNSRSRYDRRDEPRSYLDLHGSEVTEARLEPGQTKAPCVYGICLMIQAFVCICKRICNGQNS